MPLPASCVARLRCCAASARQPSLFGRRSSAPSACRAVARRAKAGGGGRTRTYEGLASGFTVRPLCRSGHSSTGPSREGPPLRPRASRAVLWRGGPGCQLEKRRRLVRCQLRKSAAIRAAARFRLPLPRVVRHPVRSTSEDRDGEASRAGRASGGAAKGGQRAAGSAPRFERAGVGLAAGRRAGPPAEKPARGRTRPRAAGRQPRRLSRPPAPPAAGEAPIKRTRPAPALWPPQRRRGPGQSRPQGAARCTSRPARPSGWREHSGRRPEPAIVQR